MRKNWWKWLLGAVVGVTVLVVGGTWLYINVLRDDPPARLSFEELDASTTTSAAVGTTSPTAAGGSGTTTPATTTPTTNGTGPATTPAGGAAQAGIDGTWAATPTSELGYRVKEVLFGQDAEGVGRTNAVTGSIDISGTTVTGGSFSVDMATMKSDSSQRDNQFRNRIMDTSTHPTATFKLTQPIELGTVPADGQQITASATGDLTLRGTTKSVTFDVTARLSSGQVQVNGTIPIVFAEWNIPNPSFGPAQTEDNGVLEFLLVFER